MDEPAQAYEGEPYYAPQRGAQAGTRILWGRLVTLGVALLVAFVLGRVSAPDGVPASELTRARQQLSDARGEIARLKSRATAPSPAPTPTTAPQGPASPTPTARPSPTPSPRADATREYVVQAGDTLGSIAAKFYGDATLAQFLAEANNIQDRSKIRVGQKLVIPPKPTGR